MKMMKAFVKANETDTTFSLIEQAVPQITQDEYLVCIYAIGVGIHDGYFLPEQMTFPYTIGIEAAGVIEEVGNNTEGFSVGDRVAFVSSMHPSGGTWGEYAAVAKDALMIKIPDKMNFTSAAAIPVAGNTVLKAFTALNLKSGDSLFIAGASGAIGTFAIQLAKAAGVHVAGSASPGNHAYMKELGADLTVDYNDSTWAEQVKEWKRGGVDAALAIQPQTGATSMEVVKDGGIVVPVSSDQFNAERNIFISPFPYQAEVRAELSDMIEDIAKDKITLTIEQVYPFEQALEALRKTTTRHARGKLVIELKK